MDEQKLPIFCDGVASDSVAWRHTGEVSRAQFVADVAELAAQLPDAEWVLNHCEDRYDFAVGFAAAMVRDQVSLFPSSKAPQVLQQLAADYPGVYCLTDQEDSEDVQSVMPMMRFPELAAEAGGDADLSFASTQLAAIAFTSGSTGQPKAYQRHWGAFVREARVAGKALQLDREQGGYIVATVPAQHMYGFMTSVIMPLQWRYVIGADRPFYPENIRKALAARPRPSVLVTTPVQLRACVLEQTQLPATEFILSSTAPLPADMAQQAESAFGAIVKEFYGSTETGAIAIRRQAETAVWHTFDDVTVKPAADGFEVHGKYFTASPVLLADNVDISSDRNFQLYGRNADLVKVGGKRISIGDLNQILLSIDGVNDGAFFLPDTGVDGREAEFPRR